ncbi:hypothetical protein A8P48_09870 [Yersinia pestis]|nr:hypothetical protein AU254_09580 [Yersinia pestis]PCN66292.1 hypothetical protein A8P48_09870 [Yersinia pestis]PCN66597.1 hypothetical protein A8V49_12440 [Yersinia pestis]PVU28444.1 hypothetical protein A8M58_17330 [Yersinia pestis]
MLDIFHFPLPGKAGGGENLSIWFYWWFREDKPSVHNCKNFYRYFIWNGLVISIKNIIIANIFYLYFDNHKKMFSTCSICTVNA